MGGSGGGGYISSGGSFDGNSGGGFGGARNGSGGGSGDGSGSGSGGGRLLKCPNIKFTAVLNSPQANILSTLKLGDILTVSIHSGSSISVVVSNKSGIAGSITGQYLSDLISCMQNGYDYVAKVVSVNGGKCDVEVFHQ